MNDEHEEGWYTDPYGRHQARWMSSGSPTKLVRDGSVESYEDPPDEEPSGEATQIVEESLPDGGLRRADDAETESLPTGGEIAGAAVFGSLTNWRLNRHNRRDT